MRWNSQEGYIRYTSALTALKSLLGISQIDYYTERCELSPYVTYILEYLVRELVLLGEDSDIKLKVQRILDIFEYGADQIISGATISLACEVGISTSKFCVEGEEVPFDRDRFVFTWSNVMTALCVRLRFQYAYLFTPAVETECCTCGAVGQTYRDFESWRSDVYPNDEVYDRTNYLRNHSQWTTDIQAPECTKCYRTVDNNG